MDANDGFKRVYNFRLIVCVFFAKPSCDNIQFENTAHRLNKKPKYVKNLCLKMNLNIYM